LLNSPNPPILLEVEPYRFHPSWAAFESVIDRSNIERAKVTVTLPANLNDEKIIEFRRQQSGGVLLDLRYAMSMLCSIFNVAPRRCDKIQITTSAVAQQDGDYRYEGTWRFPDYV
jgi:hypothetical protein